MTNAAVRSRNLARLFDRLLTGGTTTRAALVTATGLSKATVARLVTELEAQGLVEAQDLAPDGTTLGRKPEGLGVPRPLGHVIGFSLGLRGSHAIAFDLAGREVGSRLEQTPWFDDAEQAVRWATEFVQGLSGSIEGAGRLLRVCAAIPGRVRAGVPISTVPDPLNILQGVPVRESLEQALGTPTLLETDAEMALAGATLRGDIEEQQSVVLFAMSTMLTVATRTRTGMVEARTAALGDFVALPIPLSGLRLERGGAGILGEGDASAANPPQAREMTAGELLSVRGITEYSAALGRRIERTEELWTCEDQATARVRGGFLAALDAAIRVAAITTDPDVCVLTGRLAPLAENVLPELVKRLAETLDEPPDIVVTGNEDNGLTTARGAARNALALERSRIVARVREGERLEQAEWPQRLP